MDGPALVNFPLPMLTALLCGVLAGLVWRLDLGLTRARMAFSLLFALCMLESLLVGLRFGYGMTAMIPLQRVLPLLLGALMYLSFAALSVDARAFWRMAALHIAVPVVIVALFWATVSDLRHFDWIIAASYLFYVAALFRLWRRGPDALIFAPVDVAARLSRWVLNGAALLVFVLVLDSAIALDFMLNGGTNAPTLISVGTAPLIAALIAALVAVSSIMARAPRVKSAAPGDEDAGVEQRLRQLLEAEKLFLDPDLSVQRLAKRLHLPARDVSGAINRLCGTNISQYVNDFRLAHAVDLLARSGDSVGEIAARSGFMSRSNFYREFQRAYGQSPTEFRRSQKAAASKGI